MFEPAGLKALWHIRESPRTIPTGVQVASRPRTAAPLARGGVATDPGARPGTAPPRFGAPRTPDAGDLEPVAECSARVGETEPDSEELATQIADEARTTLLLAARAPLWHSAKEAEDEADATLGEADTVLEGLRDWTAAREEEEERLRHELEKEYGFSLPSAARLPGAFNAGGEADEAAGCAGLVSVAEEVAEDPEVRADAARADELVGVAREEIASMRRWRVELEGSLGTSDKLELLGTSEVAGQDSPRLSALRQEVEHLKTDGKESSPSWAVESQPPLPQPGGAAGLALVSTDWSLAEVDRRMASLWVPADDDALLPKAGCGGGASADAADLERGIDELLAELDEIDLITQDLASLPKL